MSFTQEPDYHDCEYHCPHCGHDYTEAGSIKKHADGQVCPECGKIASEPKSELVTL